MTRIAIVYHSGYGHTKKQAEAVRAGAAELGEAELIAIDAEGNLPADGWERLEAADAIVFGTPTYMGMASWQFKKFADASSKPWFAQKWKDKIAAGFTNSASMNGDKLSTLHYLFTLAMQHSGIWVGTGMMPSNASAKNTPAASSIADSLGINTRATRQAIVAASSPKRGCHAARINPSSEGLDLRTADVFPLREVIPPS